LLNRGQHTEHFDAFVTSPDSQLRSAVARLGNENHINKLLNDPLYSVRDKLIQNSHLTIEHMRTLSKDKNSYVRASLFAALCQKATYSQSVPSDMQERDDIAVSIAKKLPSAFDEALNGNCLTTRMPKLIDYFYKLFSKNYSERFKLLTSVVGAPITEDFEDFEDATLCFDLAVKDSNVRIRAFGALHGNLEQVKVLMKDSRPSVAANAKIRYTWLKNKNPKKKNYHTYIRDNNREYNGYNGTQLNLDDD
jgi:hypothetical protein